MTRAPLSLLALLALTLLLGCPPTDDDDSGPLDDDDVVEDDDDAVDDDDSGADDDDAVDDDDSGATDDDDAADDDDDADDDDAVDDDDIADDDDSATDCTAPPAVQASISVTDTSGVPSTTLTSAGLTIMVSVRNHGGGTESQTYSSSCIFSWQLDDGAGGYLGGGPDCLAVITQQAYTCGEEPVVQTTQITDTNASTGVPLDPGTYWLAIDTFFYGATAMQVTVP